MAANLDANAANIAANAANIAANLNALANAAAPIPLHDALAQMGFAQPTINYMTTRQGMDSLEEFKILTDDEVESLCKVLRRPGGTTGNPPRPHPGFAVSIRAELNLKLMCYALRFGERTSRTVNAIDLTLDTIHKMKMHREWEKGAKDVPPPDFTEKDWSRMIDAIEEWLCGCLGVLKIPLAYVI